MDLIIGDIHLSDRPKDSYRFGLIPWLVKLQRKYSPRATFFLGDITQEKDNHSSALVNRTVDALTQLAPPVYVLRGNHDGRDPGSPYFKFLNHIDGLRFVVDPTWLAALDVAMIPHCRTQKEFDLACSNKMFEQAQCLMLHNTFDGAIAETGARLSGLSASPIARLKPLKVYAGDVHKPQIQPPVTYVGAPFHVRFGDAFEPRILLVNGKQEKDLHFECPRKWSLKIRDADELTKNHKLHQGDQVKLTIELSREEAAEWPQHKQRILAVCKELGLEVHGAEVDVKAAKPVKAKVNDVHIKKPETVVAEFAKAERLAANVRDAGLELVQHSEN